MLFWLQSGETFQKLEDVTRAVQEELINSCKCDITSDNIDKASFRCFDPSSLYVTYRARLKDIEIGSDTLISYIEDWVSKGLSISVQGVLLKIDSKCAVSLNTIDDGECEKISTPSSSQSSAGNTAAIVGGSVAVTVVLIIAVLVFAVTVLVLMWKSRQGKLSFNKE